MSDATAYKSILLVVYDDDPDYDEVLYRVDLHPTVDGNYAAIAEKQPISDTTYQTVKWCDLPREVQNEVRNNLPDDSMVYLDREGDKAGDSR